MTNLEVVALNGWNTLADLSPGLRRTERKQLRRDYAQHAISSGLWSPEGTEWRATYLRGFSRTRWFRRCHLTHGGQSYQKRHQKQINTCRAMRGVKPLSNHD